MALLFLVVVVEILLIIFIINCKKMNLLNNINIIQLYSCSQSGVREISENTT